MKITNQLEIESRAYFEEFREVSRRILQEEASKGANKEDVPWRDVLILLWVVFEEFFKKEQNKKKERLNLRNLYVLELEENYLKHFDKIIEQTSDESQAFLRPIDRVIKRLRDVEAIEVKDLANQRTDSPPYILTKKGLYLFFYILSRAEVFEHENDFLADFHYVYELMERVLLTIQKGILFDVLEQDYSFLQNDLSEQNVTPEKMESFLNIQESIRIRVSGLNKDLELLKQELETENNHKSILNKKPFKRGAVLDLLKEIEPSYSEYSEQLTDEYLIQIKLEIILKNRTSSIEKKIKRIQAIKNYLKEKRNQAAEKESLLQKYPSVSDLDDIKTYLSKGHARDQDNEGKTIIMKMFPLSEWKQIISLKEFDLDLQDDYGVTALHQAVGCWDAIDAKELLRSGANPNIEDIKGETPIFLFWESDYEEKLIELLKFGAKIGHKNKQGQTPLVKAVLLGRVDIAKLLIKYGASESELLERGEELLKGLIEEQKKEGIEFLVERGIVDRSNNFKSDSIIVEIAKLGDVEWIKRFRDKGHSLLEKNHMGETILTVAIGNKCFEIVDYLAKTEDAKELFKDNIDNIKTKPLVKAVNSFDQQIFDIVIKNTPVIYEQTFGLILKIAIAKELLGVLHWLIENRERNEFSGLFPNLLSQHSLEDFIEKYASYEIFHYLDKVLYEDRLSSNLLQYHPYFKNKDLKLVKELFEIKIKIIINYKPSSEEDYDFYYWSYRGFYEEIIESKNIELFKFCLENKDFTSFKEAFEHLKEIIKKCGCVEHARILIEKDLFYNEFFWTEDEELLALLLEKGLHKRNKINFLPDDSIAFRHLGKVELLLKNEFKVSESNIINAIEQNELEVLELLLENNGTLVMEHFLLVRSERMRDFLRRKFQEKSIKNNFSRWGWKEGTLIRAIAYEGGSFPQFKKILENNMDELDKKDIFGRTALFYACLFKNLRMVSFLIDKGANFEAKDNRKDKEKKSPLDLILENDSRFLMEFLKSPKVLKSSLLKKPHLDPDSFIMLVMGKARFYDTKKKAVSFYVENIIKDRASKKEFLLKLYELKNNTDIGDCIQSIYQKHGFT